LDICFGLEIEVRNYYCRIYDSSIDCFYYIYIYIYIYSIIFYDAHKSTHRVTEFRQATIAKLGIVQPYLSKLKREMKLMKNILILIGILTSAGCHFLTLVFWHAFASNSPAVSVYILTMLNITGLFYMNNDVKTVAMKYFRKLIIITGAPGQMSLSVFFNYQKEFMIS